MSFFDDLKRLRKVWHKLSTFTKLLQICALILSFMLIAGLADTVFEFKLFLAHAIEFWHTITGFVLEKIEASLGVQIPVVHIDFYVLFALIFFPYLMASWNVIGSRKRIINVLGVLSWISAPLIIPIDALMVLALVVYFFTLIMFLWPPIEDRFLLISLRMALPPIAVATIAAITEGLARPI